MLTEKQKKICEKYSARDEKGLSELFQEQKELKSQIINLNNEFNEAKNKVSELNVIQKNIEVTLEIKLSDSDEKEKFLQREKEEKSK